MKTKSMLLKAQKLTPKEMGFVEGGTNEADKTLDGGTLDEVIKAFCNKKDKLIHIFYV